MINDMGMQPLTDRERMWCGYGLSASEARWFDWCFERGLLNLFGSDFPQFDTDNEKIGRYINNVLRSKKTIDELGNCNSWDFFVTFTISPDKFDRHDLQGFYKKFAYFIQNYKRLHKCKFDYVFVPELHADGAWHLHGLIGGMPFENFQRYNLFDYFPYTDVRIPNYIRTRLAQGHELYYWQAYVDRFGWCVVERLRDSEKASNYITKYIGKGFSGNDEFKNVRMIKSSLGLKRAEKLKKGFTSIKDVKPSYDCDYATVFKFKKTEYTLDDVLKYFYDNDNMTEH